MSNLFSSGIRPAIDAYLEEKSKEIRSYGDYWSASSAGYCHRKLIFERLGVPPVKKEGDERKTRVFEAGHIFHKFVQDITKNAGLSIAQELELQDEELMIRGHIDDLVLVASELVGNTKDHLPHLILYDYKTQNSGAFTWQKGRPTSYYHRLQVGTYMYMLRTGKQHKITNQFLPDYVEVKATYDTHDLMEARVLKISKDDLRMDENQILWDAQLEADVLNYWNTLNRYWAERKVPPCTCHQHEGGFMAKEAFNPYFYDARPCSLELYKQWRKEKS